MVAWFSAFISSPLRFVWLQLSWPSGSSTWTATALLALGFFRHEFELSSTFLHHRFECVQIQKYALSFAKLYEKLREFSG